MSLSLEAEPLDDLKDRTRCGCDSTLEPAPSRDGFSVKTASLFFGSSSLGAPAENMESWQPGEAPMVVHAGPRHEDGIVALRPPRISAKANESGESIAAKGEVNADNQRAKTPAERLGLFDEKVTHQVGEVSGRGGLFRSARRSRARPDRGGAGGDEPGVLGLLPDDGVWRGLPEQVPPHGLPVHLRLRQCRRRRARARYVGSRQKDFAKAMLDGELWLPEVDKSTHYHAYWVHPSWVAEMKKMYKFGVHTFYRPRAWGRRQRGAELGYTGTDRRDLGGTR